MAVHNQQANNEIEDIPASAGMFCFLAISACENSHVNVNKNKKIKLLRSHLNMLEIFKDRLSFDSRTASTLTVTPTL